MVVDIKNRARTRPLVLTLGLCLLLLVGCSGGDDKEAVIQTVTGFLDELKVGGLASALYKYTDSHNLAAALTPKHEKTLEPFLETFRYNIMWVNKGESVAFVKVTITTPDYKLMLEERRKQEGGWGPESEHVGQYMFLDGELTTSQEAKELIKEAIEHPENIPKKETHIELRVVEVRVDKDHSYWAISDPQGIYNLLRVIMPTDSPPRWP